jgi:hypothetical protein
MPFRLTLRLSVRVGAEEFTGPSSGVVVIRAVELLSTNVELTAHQPISLMGSDVRVWTRSGPDASAQSVGRVARLSGNVRHVLANEIAGHKAERRPGAGEEWLAATKNDGVEVKSILINKTKVG